MCRLGPPSLVACHGSGVLVAPRMQSSQQALQYRIVNYTQGQLLRGTVDGADGPVRVQHARTGPTLTQAASACSRATIVAGAPAASLVTVKSNRIRAKGLLRPT